MTLFSVCAAQPDNNILGQCMLVGLEVDRAGLDISGCEGVYRYLRPLTTEETLATLTGFLVKRELATRGDAELLLTRPIVRNQLALAGGLPHVISISSDALEVPETLRSLRAALSTKKEMR